MVAMSSFVRASERARTRSRGVAEPSAMRVSMASESREKTCVLSRFSLSAAARTISAMDTVSVMMRVTSASTRTWATWSMELVS